MGSQPRHNRGVTITEQKQCVSMQALASRTKTLPPLLSIDKGHYQQYKHQQQLGLVLLELKRHREKLLLDNNTTIQAHQQRTITTSFNPIMPFDSTHQRGLHKWAPDQDIATGLHRLGNSNMLFTYAPASRMMITPPLSSTNTGHYLMPLQVLPMLWGSVHFGQTYARALLNIRIRINLT